MKSFLDDNFLLHSTAAEKLFHDYAAKMPIIDYHNHLPPQEIAGNRTFENLTQAWLQGDHYKWRAMRANGIDERFITGNASDSDKFNQWAATVPFTARNPLFHWTQLELKNPFGITELLNPASAQAIYERASLKLKDLPVQKLLSHFNVRVVCTTDDPIDNLEHHLRLKNEKFSIRVLPTFRPDQAMKIDAPSHNEYINKLEKAAGVAIASWDDLIIALQKRHDFFAACGCKLSDHGLETFYAEPYGLQEVRMIFDRARSGKPVNESEAAKFKSACLYEFAVMDAAKNWTQQYHVGAIRNNNSRLLKQAGADAGTDSIGDFKLINSLSRFLDRLDTDNLLAKTIIYNLNPADNHSVASMMGNFNDGSIPGKMQYGAAWWFLDQKDGMEEQLNVLSNLGLLSRFVGMLTDSRSFLSFSRHEYFRRILCNLIGDDIERGELPSDFNWLGGMVQDICYNNAERYFKF